MVYSGHCHGDNGWDKEADSQAQALSKNPEHPELEGCGNSHAPETDSQAQTLSKQSEHHELGGWGNPQVEETDSQAQALGKQPFS